MTMPNERTRALVWAGGFLIELARNRVLAASDIEDRRRPRRLGERCLGRCAEQEGGSETGGGETGGETGHGLTLLVVTP